MGRKPAPAASPRILWAAQPAAQRPSLCLPQPATRGWPRVLSFLGGGGSDTTEPPATSPSWGQSQQSTAGGGSGWPGVPQRPGGLQSAHTRLPQHLYILIGLWSQCSHPPKTCCLWQQPPSKPFMTHLDQGRAQGGVQVGGASVLPPFSTHKQRPPSSSLPSISEDKGPLGI